ncbi:hypothetical protein T4A_3547, partial [Trichinella pseudospiralis]
NSGAFVCLIYVASGSVVKRKTLHNHFVNIWTMKKRKRENADDTKQIEDYMKQIEDDTKQNRG